VAAQPALELCRLPPYLGAAGPAPPPPPPPPQSQLFPANPDGKPPLSVRTVPSECGVRLPLIATDSAAFLLCPDLSPTLDSTRLPLLESCDLRLCLLISFAEKLPSDRSQRPCRNNRSLTRPRCGLAICCSERSTPSVPPRSVERSSVPPEFFHWTFFISRRLLMKRLRSLSRLPLPGRQGIPNPYSENPSKDSPIRTSPKVRPWNFKGGIFQLWNLSSNRPTKKLPLFFPRHFFTLSGLHAFYWFQCGLRGCFFSSPNDLGPKQNYSTEQAPITATFCLTYRYFIRQFSARPTRFSSIESLNGTYRSSLIPVMDFGVGRPFRSRRLLAFVPWPWLRSVLTPH